MAANESEERERTAVALRQSQDRLSGIVDSAMDAIITVDQDHRIVLFNAAAEKMFGYAAAELIGHPLDGLLPERSRASHSGHIQRFGAAGATSRSMGALGAVSGVRRNGEEFPIEASISHVALGEQRLYTVILRDITQRKRAELAAAELAGIVESSADAIIGKDLHGIVRSWNAGAENLFGYSAAEMIGRPILLLVPSERHHEEEEILRRIRRGDAVRHFDTVRVCKDGRQIDVSVTVSAIKDSDGRVVGASKVARDITDRIRAAAELRELNATLEQRVAERTAELEAFSYSVSHDLRAPLRTVDGFSQALLEDFGPILPDEGRRLVQTIREGAQRMGRLIDDLLAFSRLGRQPLSPTAGVDMGQLVREALDDLAAERQGRHVEMLIARLPVAHGDPALLRQVWTNLLSNALKYTRRRETAFVEVGFDDENAETVYFVRDNGSGFDMRYAKKLFGVFQRLHRAEEFEGSGVGLAIVQRIVERHGGRVWADAAVERGATLRFTIPAGSPS